MNNPAQRFTRKEEGRLERIGRAGATVSGLLARFAVEDGGQDIVEYALLAAFIGIAGWAIIMTLPTVMGTTYASWLDPNNGVPGQWDPPEPAGS
jgi:Flp pilus assembly pilin Flp